MISSVSNGCTHVEIFILITKFYIIIYFFPFNLQIQKKMRVKYINLKENEDEILHLVHFFDLRI